MKTFTLKWCSGIVKLRVIPLSGVCVCVRVCVDCQLFKQQHIGSSQACYNDSLLSRRKEPRSEFTRCPQPSDPRLGVPYSDHTARRRTKALKFSSLRASPLHCRNLDGSLSNLSKSSQSSASLSALRRLAHYSWRRICVKPGDFS